MSILGRYLACPHVDREAHVHMHGNTHVTLQEATAQFLNPISTITVLVSV